MAIHPVSKGSRDEACWKAAERDPSPGALDTGVAGDPSRVSPQRSLVSQLQRRARGPTLRLTMSPGVGWGAAGHPSVTFLGLQ